MRLLLPVLLLGFLLGGVSVLTAQRADLGQLEVQWKSSPTPERAIALSKACQDQAWWFFKRPQFNNDSSIFYFDKARNLLENARDIPAEHLSELYTNLCEYRYLRSEPEIAAEMGAKALSSFEKADKARQNKMLFYQILRRYALAELLNDHEQHGLELYKKSTALFQNETNPAIVAMLWKDKGIFHGYYSNGINDHTEFESLKFIQKTIVGKDFGEVQPL